MNVVGQTADGKKVVDVYPLVGTHGMPMSVVCELCLKEGLVIAPLEFYRGAWGDGWKHETILSRIRDGMVDGGHPLDQVRHIVDTLDNAFASNSGQRNPNSGLKRKPI